MELEHFLFGECILLVHIILPSQLLPRNKLKYTELIVPVVV